MWYVETLAAFSTIAAGLTVVLGAIGLVAFQAPRFLLNITGGLLGLAINAPAWIIVHRAIN